MMVTARIIDLARQAADDLRKRGESERARAIDALIEAAATDALPSLDLLTTTKTGQLLGVSGQTIKNWIRAGKFVGFRVGERVMVPREAIEEYVRRARKSLDLDEVSDAEAAQLVAEARSRR